MRAECTVGVLEPGELCTLGSPVMNGFQVGSAIINQIIDVYNLLSRLRFKCPPSDDNASRCLNIQQRD